MDTTWMHLTPKELAGELALYDGLISKFGEIRRDADRLEYDRLVGIRQSMYRTLEAKLLAS